MATLMWIRNAGPAFSWPSTDIFLGTNLEASHTRFMRCDLCGDIWGVHGIGKKADFKDRLAAEWEWRFDPSRDACPQCATFVLDD